MNKKKIVIWSSVEVSPFLEPKIKRLEKETNKNIDLDNPAIVKSLIDTWKVENEKFKTDIIKTQFNRRVANEIVGCIIIKEGTVKIGQDLIRLGYNVANIFDLPYEHITWYVDAYNLKAIAYVNEIIYDFTFREMRDDSQLVNLEKRIKSREKLLTPTLMGQRTKSLLNK